MEKIGMRKSLLELQKEYEKDNKKPLGDLRRAWKGIKELDSKYPKSLYCLVGFHGEPVFMEQKISNSLKKLQQKVRSYIKLK